MLNCEEDIRKRHWSFSPVKSFDSVRAPRIGSRELWTIEDDALSVGVGQKFWRGNESAENFESCPAETTWAQWEPGLLIAVKICKWPVRSPQFLAWPPPHSTAIARTNTQQSK